MAWGKNHRGPRALGVAAAAGIALFGVHLYRTVQTAATAPPARVASLATSTREAGLLGQITLPPPGVEGTVPRASDPKAEPGADSAPPAATPPAPPLPPGFVGPQLPARGPEWKGAPLPAFTPEVLRAMMDPKAARRAQRLPRQGITPPPEATPPSAPKAASGSPEPTPPAPPNAKALPTPPAAAPPAASNDRGPAAGSPKAASPGVTPPPVLGASSAGPQPAGPGPSPAGGRKQDPPAPAPIRLQARLDKPRPEYRAGEWVALRFLASQPAHLRAYRVEADGRVTRVFSTYDQEDSTPPARTFSLMVKAGENKPGQERVVAIGSARPLTRDELLDCLRSFLTESPTDPPAPGAETAASQPAAPAPLTLAAALQAVMTAVERAGDLPAGVAGLDRGAWSVAVGRFVSLPASSRQSAAPDPTPAPLPVR